MTIKILLLISLLLSFYSLYLITQLQNENRTLKEEQEVLKKQLNQYYIGMKNLAKSISKIDKNLTSFKSTQNTKNSSFHDKIETLYARWIIVADERITSIPNDNKSWYQAMEIVKQAPQKVWQPNKTTQSKGSMVNGGAGGHMVIEEPNQDFGGAMSDLDFKQILEDSDDDTDSSSSSNEQTKKLKPKRSKNILPY